MNMIELKYEMTYSETIDEAAGSTGRLHALRRRLCWQVTTATLRGARITATYVRMPAGPTGSGSGLTAFAVPTFAPS